MTRFQDYFAEQVKNFNTYHSNLLVKTTEEDIHKLRTTIKKLRTFNILLDGLLFRQKDFPIGFTEVFKLTGEIRDIQVQQKILEEHDDPYKIYLLYSYEYKLSHFKIKDSFDQEIKYLNDKLNKVEDYHIDEQIINNILSHIELSCSDIREMILNISPENLHEIRIKLKRNYYTLLMLGKGDIQYIEKLDNMQEIIGLWHDYDVTIERVKNFDSNLEIIKSLTIKRDLLYNESIELLKNF